MALFEGLVLLLFLSAFLLVGARRVGIPYPTLLACAGMGVAALPVAPELRIDPHLALAVFIAPALLDAAFDTSPKELRQLWLPLLVLAGGLVVLTAGAVALVGWWLAGLPLAAAVALGAIVAPPDAAASNAVLGQVGLPRRSLLILQGESLLNDAVALLLFGAAVAAAQHTAPEGGALALALAAPGGVALGLALSWVYRRIHPLFEGTLSATVVEFTSTFGVWILAERLHLSPVLAVVSFAMAISRSAPAIQSARDRVQSYAVWTSAVFVLNVLAFLLMGLQVRSTLAALPDGRLIPALWFAAAVLATVIAVRVLAVVAYRAAAGWAWARWAPAWVPEPPPWRVSMISGWTGMRGLLTLATSFALPGDFPGRAQIVLAAITVVMGTLVIQGFTLGPLIRLLRVGDDAAELADELGEARRQMLRAGKRAAEREPEPVAALLRVKLDAATRVTRQEDPQGPTRYDAGLARVVHAQRRELCLMRERGSVADDVFQRLEEELDWLELSARPNRELEVREA